MFSVFEMEEEQNATVHGLVLEVSPEMLLMLIASSPDDTSRAQQVLI